MTTPYRDQETSLVQLQRGVCPWCREAVSFAASDASAVCDRCGARYAPALATRQAIAPVVVKRSRIGYYALIAGVAGGGVLLISLALALVLVGLAVAIGIYVGVGVPTLHSRKQLPAAEPDDRRSQSNHDSKTQQ